MRFVNTLEAREMRRRLGHEAVVAAVVVVVATVAAEEDGHDRGYTAEELEECSHLVVGLSSRRSLVWGIIKEGQD